MIAEQFQDLFPPIEGSDLCSTAYNHQGFVSGVAWSFLMQAEQQAKSSKMIWQLLTKMNVGSNDIVLNTGLLVFSLLSTVLAFWKLKLVGKNGLARFFGNVWKGSTLVNNAKKYACPRLIRKKRLPIFSNWKRTSIAFTPSVRQI